MIWIKTRRPELDFNDDKGGRPVGINQHIGRRQVMAFGKSNGGQQMEEFAQGGSGARFALLGLRDDAARAFACDPVCRLPADKLGACAPEKRFGGRIISIP